MEDVGIKRLNGLKCIGSVIEDKADTAKDIISSSRERENLTSERLDRPCYALLVRMLDTQPSTGDETKLQIIEMRMLTFDGKSLGIRDIGQKIEEKSSVDCGR